MSMAELNIDQRLGRIEERLPAPAAVPLPAYVDRGSDPSAAHHVIFPQAQLELLAADLRKQGVPEERIQAALREDGQTLAPADLRTADERQFDETFAPVAADKFVMDLGPRRHTVSDEVAAAFQKEAGEAVSKMGFNQALGKSLILQSLDHQDELKGLTPEERTTWQATEDEKLDAYAARHAID